ncbi:MAG: hypothetical protein E7259_10030 [Lachnospiraceae bacterium]|nr:hypothetical protein [Lachnospiraceae bacterium]
MTEMLSDAITVWILGKECLKESDEYQVVRYGVLLTLETVYKVLIILLVGGVLGIFKETIAFFIGFSGLRRYAGGFHMKSSMGCFLMVALFWLISMTSMYVDFNAFSYVVCFMVSFVLILCFAPSWTKESVLKDFSEIKRRKYMSVMYLVVVTLIGHIINSTLTNVMVVAMLIEAVTTIKLRAEVSTNEKTVKG